MKNKTKNIRKGITAVLFAMVMIASVLAVVPTTTAFVCSRTYTLDADFDEGTLVGVEQDTVPDQLQLDKTATTLPFIWVPNSNEGTVSKVNTTDGKELGRYRVGPPTPNSNPSRTTVDLQGNCWVGNRRIGTVVKVGLDEAGQCVDRNTNGAIDTSRDTNGDGDITGAELLLWGLDECVLYEVVLIPGKVGTHIPGTYAGGYENNDWATSPRGLAIDASNNLWAGTWSTMTYFYINGSTGAIINSVNVPNHNAYGAVIDGNGVLWSSGQAGNHVLSLDPSTSGTAILPMGHFVYGLGMDNLSHLFVSGWTSNCLSRVTVSPLPGSINWTVPSPTQGRGVAVTSIDNHVWTANTQPGIVTRYNNNGIQQTTISVGSSPTGVAVDAAGKVWSVNMDGNIYRIDPSTNSVDLTKTIVGGTQHYGYSDMTGIVARSVTTKIGTWTVVFDSETADTSWGTVSWNSYEPTGTSITVKVRSSNDQSTWSSWETATNGASLSSTPDGRYIQIETTLQIQSGDVSPILYDLTVECGNLPPVADAGLDQSKEQNSYDGAEFTLDGSGSTDDGQIQPLNYTWTWAGGSATGVNPTVTFPLGTTTVTLTVYDGQYSDTDTVDITVQDTTPPVITPSGEQIVLWPPNHKYRTVEISDCVISVTDICDAGVGIDDIVITSVSSDEPEDAQGKGDGKTVDDIVIVDSQTVELRAERQGDGNGRVYTINFEVSDETGNTATGSCTVWVPHDQESGSTAIDDGASYTVTP